MHRLITLIVSSLFVIAISNCSHKKQAPVTWNLTLHDTGSGVLMDITGATILFREMTFNGTTQGELTIFDPNAYVDKTGLGQSVGGWGSPEKPGRPGLSASFWSAQQKCEIEFGPHKLTIRNKGQELEIDGKDFKVDPNQKPGFVVATEDGQVNVRKQ